MNTRHSFIQSWKISMLRVNNLCYVQLPYCGNSKWSLFTMVIALQKKEVAFFWNGCAKTAVINFILQRLFAFLNSFYRTVLPSNRMTMKKCCQSFAIWFLDAWCYQFCSKIKRMGVANIPKMQSNVGETNELRQHFGKGLFSWVYWRVEKSFGNLMELQINTLSSCQVSILVNKLNVDCRRIMHSTCNNGFERNTQLRKILQNSP